MQIKDGVSVLGLKNEITLIFPEIDRIWATHNQIAVLTGGTEPAEGRSQTTKHKLGLAVDIRTRYFSTDEVMRVEAELKQSLGSQYYVLYHGNHIHIQFNG